MIKTKTIIIIFFLIALFALLSFGIYQAFSVIQSDSNELRVLVTSADAENTSYGLHRIEMPVDRERALLQRFAAENGLTLKYVPVAKFSDLFLALNKGEGDLISSNLSETPQRKKNYLLSIPFDYTKEILFTSERNAVKGAANVVLAGKTGWLLPGTSYVANLKNFAKVNSWCVYRILEETISHDALIERVNNETIAYSVLNECDLDAWLAYRSGIRKLYTVRDNVPLVFAARKNSKELIQRLNEFIYRQQIISQDVLPDEKNKSATRQPVQKVGKIKKSEPAPAVAKVSVSVQPVKPKPPVIHAVKSAQHFDLAMIKKRGFIRLITSNDIFTCYLKKGNLCGFEYELAKRFADSLNVRIVTVIPKNFDELLKYLHEGRGDFIAVNFTASPERLENYPDLTYCAPYYGAIQVLVGRENERRIRLADLASRKIYVRKGNVYYNTLRKLQKQGVKLNIVTVPEDETGIRILRKVESGAYDLTVVDDNFLNFAMNGGCKVRMLLALTEKEPFAWIVPKACPELATAVNNFFKKENKSAFFNLCVARYYSEKHARELDRLTSNQKLFAISPYDKLFQKYGFRYKFNWFLLAAQSYQESHFQPDTVNHIGATGLMQMMPNTAKEMGIKNLKDPENGIHAGTKYLAKQRDRFSQQLSMQNRICFALASYNAGYGHVQDARSLAEKKGWDPNVWFGNTEKAMALLEDPYYASKAKYGFCRASETIPYVRNIMIQTYHYQKIFSVQQEKKLWKKKKK